MLRSRLLPTTLVLPVSSMNNLVVEMLYSPFICTRHAAEWTAIHSISSSIDTRWRFGRENHLSHSSVATVVASDRISWPEGMAEWVERPFPICIDHWSLVESDQWLKNWYALLPRQAFVIIRKRLWLVDSVRIMWLSGVVLVAWSPSGAALSNKSPWVCKVAIQDPSWYDLRCCQDLKSQQHQLYRISSSTNTRWWFGSESHLSHSCVASFYRLFLPR